MVTVEEIKKYWDQRPCNVRHSVAPLGSLDWSREVTERKYFVEPHIKDLAQFERWRGKKILEVGCGIGTDTLEFIRHGAEVTAVDLSMTSLRLAWKRQLEEFQGMNRNLADMHAVNAEDWLPPGPFDMVYSFGVLHHTLYPTRVLKNIYLRLKPGGELRIMLYARLSLKFLLGEQPEAQLGCPEVKLYTGYSARKLLQAFDFQVLSVRKTHIFPWKIKDYIEYRYVKRWPWSHTPSWLFNQAERLLGHHLLIVARRPLVDWTRSVAS